MYAELSVRNGVFAFLPRLRSPRSSAAESERTESRIENLAAVSIGAETDFAAVSLRPRLAARTAESLAKRAEAAESLLMAAPMASPAALEAFSLRICSMESLLAVAVLTESARLTESMRMLSGL